LLDSANSRAKTIVIWFVLVFMLSACGVGTITESTDRGSYYFRMKANYSHDGQPIDFDIVVACGIRIDRYRGGESGFLAARYPRFFVKRTHENHAVMQIVPNACRGETTEDGRVPNDFLPGVIWFDKPDDYRFGIAYVSEDAFESPTGKLKFHGASIQKATRVEWEAFRKSAAEIEGLRQRYYDRPPYTTEEAAQIADADGDEVEAAYARDCFGVTRFRLSNEARAIVRKHWPKNRPRFWATNGWVDGPWPELARHQRSNPIFTSGFRYAEHLGGGNYEHGGFPTRARRGMIYSRSYKIVPSELFPAHQDRGIPWVFSDDVAKSQFLSKDVLIRTGPGKGFLYCFTALSRKALAITISDYTARKSRVRVDGERLQTPNTENWHWISPFYETDEFIYFEFNIPLS